MFFWFSRRFLEHQQNLRENQKYQSKPKNTQQTFGKTKKHIFLKVSDPPLDMDLFLLFFWFSRRFLQNKQNIRENQTTTKTKPYPRVGLKHLKTLFFWFSRRFLWFSLVFFGIFGFPEVFFGF